MNKKKSIIITSIIFVIILVILSVIIAINLPRKYRIPVKVLSKLDYEASDFVENYETYKQYYDYTKLYEDDNGDLVFVLTRKQTQGFKEIMYSQIESAEYSYKKKGVVLKYDEDLSDIQVECKTEDFGNYISMNRIKSIMGTAYFYQVFNGVELYEIRISLSVRDIYTGEMIYEDVIDSNIE